MVSDIFGIFEIIFSKCVEWSTSLFERTGATPFYVAAMIIVFVVSFLVVPLRGGNIGDMGSNYSDYTRNKTYTPRYWNGRSNTKATGYRGKFERGKDNQRILANRNRSK